MKAAWLAVLLALVRGDGVEPVRPAPPAELMRTIVRLAEEDPERAAGVAAWAAAALEADEDRLAIEPGEELEPEESETDVEAPPRLFDLPEDDGDAAAALRWAAEVRRSRSEPAELEALAAEFRYAEGVVRHGQEQFDAAARAFESSLALAGAGELRHAAAYNAGTAKLAAAERQRAQMLAAEQQGAPPPGAPPIHVSQPAPSPAGAPAADPIAALRAAYLAAKQQLLVRLRMDFEDEDTRANLELVQRRLRELDEMERQQEEQQKQQQEQQQQDQEGDQQEQEQDQKSGEQDQKDESKKESGEEQQNPEQGEEPKNPEDGAADPMAPPPQPDPAQEQQGTPPPQDASAQREPAERMLSREEVLHLLDQLEKLEAEAQALQALLRESRRVPVEKDW